MRTRSVDSPTKCPFCWTDDLTFDDGSSMPWVCKRCGVRFTGDFLLQRRMLHRLLWFMAFVVPAIGIYQSGNPLLGIALGAAGTLAAVWPRKNWP